MDFNIETENKIRELSNKYMEKARPGWGVDHVNASVFYIKELINKEGGNPNILIPTMYFHDIGYAGLLKKGYTHEQNHSAKEDHMFNGAEMTKQILRKIKGFSNEEINQISNLIMVHDNLDQINTKERQLVFEADCLGMIDVNKIKFSYKGEDLVNWLNRFKERRASRFKTKTGLRILNELLPLAEKNHG